MYARAQSLETDPARLLAAIEALRLGAFVVTRDGALTAAHLPVIATQTPQGLILEAHVARGNPLWRAAGDGAAALASFQGPHAYVHPGWYASKAEDGRVVPTWTYIAVHAHGRLEAVHDGAWLTRHLDAITAQQEADQPRPWAVSDAPEDYIAGLKRGIVGLRLAVGRLEGVWKLNQHHAEANRRGVIAGMSAGGADARRVADAMRALEHDRS
ncbi:MAG: transcriptional regulator [Rhodobacterales bacterium CG_4_9_14_3_um_filter_71_31]|nr:MAG: transcriptional regulator [Rhodobacterales bacterium CG_4_9_14_3_um_filter_71_31]